MPGQRKGLPPQEALPETISSDADTSKGTATLRRDEGIQTALDALQPVWRSYAEEALDALIGGGQPFTADDVRDMVGEPTGTGSTRALGGLIRGRVTSGEITQNGWAISRQPQRHGGVVRVWQAVAR